MVTGRMPAPGQPALEAVQRGLPFAAAALGTGTAAAAFSLWAECRCTGLSLADESLVVGSGLLFVAIGLIAWLRRGSRRVGVLMSAVGITWHVIGLRYLANPVTYTAGELGAGICNVLIGHLAVAFPTGRLRSRSDRVVVALLYGLYLPTRLSFLVFRDPAPAHPTSDNLVLVWPNRMLDQAGQLVFAAYAVGMTLVVAAVVIGHWRRTTRVGRRALAPLLWAVVPVSVSVIALATLDVTHSSVPLLLGEGAMALGFLAGIVRSELDRAGVSRLVIELGEAPARDDLRDALARTLHDPSLAMAYWLPERGEYVDAGGLPVRLPDAESDRAATVLLSSGEPIAAVVHDAALESDPRLLEATMAAARLAIQHERFQVEIQSQLEAVRASRSRILAAADAERRRIERRLHERVQQPLARLSLALAAARANLGPGDDPALDATLGEAVEDTSAALQELREFAQGVHPAVLTESGLRPALESLASGLRLPVTISEVPDGRFQPAVEAATYYVIAEALTNVVKHARASTVTVTVTQAGGELRAEVRDDGVGGASPGPGSGLQGMADRVAALDGNLEVVSPAGGATVVRFALPARPPAGDRRPETATG